MRIGIVTTWCERGAAYVSKCYMRSLSREHEVFVYARGGEHYAIGDPDWDFENVTWSPRFLADTYTAVCPIHLHRWISRNRIDVVLFNEQQDVAVLHHLNDHNVKIGAYVDYYTRNGSTSVESFDIYDYLFCNTKRHFSVFKNHKACHFIQWGTDVDLFTPAPSFPDPIDAPSVVFFHSAGMGGINLRKGTDLLVKAFQKVHGNAKLLIHSQAPLAKFSAVSGVISTDSRISFIHRTVPAPGLYRLGDVYVYPSRLDGIGLTVPEALSSGLAVITTHAPPMNEFIEHGVNGMLVDVTEVSNRDDDYYWPQTEVNEDDLAAKMQFYVDNPEILVSHKKQARESATTRFSWAANSTAISEIFTQMKISPQRNVPVRKLPGLYMDVPRRMILWAWRKSANFLDRRIKTIERNLRVRMQDG